MEKRMLGKTGLMVSAVTYGGIVSTDDGFDRAFPAGDGQEESDRYVEYAIKRGVNYFDVAPQYGNAQGRLGVSLAPHRKDVHIACKSFYRTADDLERDLEVSLKHLKTDYFDVYQLHALVTVEMVERAFAKGGAMEPVLRAKAAGTLRHLGITCHSEEAALRALELYDFETIMFPTNWGLHMKKGFGEKVLRAKREKNLGLLGMKSLVHRAWKDDKEKTSYLKSWCKPIDKEDVAFRVAAMKYALSMGADTLVPPGNFECFSFVVEHIDECLKNPLSEADRELLQIRLPEIEGLEFF
jgi:aryl-alcohol dehydrogenase-like predicted oxidoreductase